MVDDHSTNWVYLDLLEIDMCFVLPFGRFFLSKLEYFLNLNSGDLGEKILWHTALR